MAAPAGLTVRTKLSDMQIGDCIPCRIYTSSYRCFSDLGNDAVTELPLNPNTAPNGKFYFIKVKKGLLIADRMVQSSQSYHSLNTNGFAYGAPVMARNVTIQSNGADVWGDDTAVYTLHTNGTIGKYDRSTRKVTLLVSTAVVTSPLYITGDSTNLYVTSSSEYNIAVISRTDGTVTKVATGYGSSKFMCQSDTRLFVLTAQNPGSIVVITKATSKVEKTISTGQYCVGMGPESIWEDKDTIIFGSAHSYDKVFILNKTTLVLDQIQVTAYIRSVWADDKQIYCGISNQALIYVIDRATKAVTSLNDPMGSYYTYYLAGNSDYLVKYNQSNYIEIIRRGTNEMVRQWYFPQGIITGTTKFEQVGDKVYFIQNGNPMGMIYMIDLKTLDLMPIWVGYYSSAFHVTQNTISVVSASEAKLYLSEDKTDIQLIRSMTGGMTALSPTGTPTTVLTYDLGAYPPDNEYDTYICNSDLNGKITPGDNKVWNYGDTTYQGTITVDSWDPSYSTFVRRGANGVNTNVRGMQNSNMGYTDGVAGFRPVMEYIDNDKSISLWS